MPQKNAGGPRRGRLFRYSRTTLIVLAVLVVSLAALRLALPGLLLDYVNRTIDGLPEYEGRVADLDLALWRGAIQVKGLTLRKKGGKVPVPFLDVPLTDASIQWSELFHGALVGEVHVTAPEVNVVEGPTKEASQTSLSREWIDTARKFVPLRINHFTVSNGTVHFRKYDATPKVDVHLNDIQVRGRNLVNSRSLQKERFGTVNATARAMNEAPCSLDLDIDPLAPEPTFYLTAELKKLNLTRLNNLLRAYGNFDVHSGRFSLYTEITASKGAFNGYAKPFFEDMEVVNLADAEKGPLQLLWEGLVGGVASLLENEETRDVATKIPLSGRFDDPEPDVAATIVNLLRNAFVRALRQGIEGSLGRSDLD